MKIIIFDAGRRNHIQTGYGIMSRQLGTRLVNRGYEVFYFDEHTFPDKVDMWLWIRPPHYVRYKEFNPDNCNVFFTMCEQEKLIDHKSEWPELLNKCDALITPTAWNKEVWINNNVTIPIHVCPLGVNTKVFKGYQSYEFSILSVFEGLGSNAREDWKTNIEAYYELFYDKHCDEVSYTIKSWTVNWDSYREFLRQLIKSKGYEANKLPAINVIDTELVPVDMNALYSKHWLFLKNTRGEGWSLPGLEALASGLNIVTTKLLAMAYLNEDNCTYFNGIKDLKSAMWNEWKKYRSIKLDILKWSWKESTIELDKILKRIKESVNET